MEFIDPGHSLNIRDKNWRILAKNTISPPHFLTENADVKNSLVVDGCYVAGKVEHSILSNDVQVKEGAKVIDSVIMPGATIGKNVQITKAIIGENAIIGDDAVVDGSDEIAVVGYSEVIGVLTSESE
jgi:glucose-1-phosphate adenylyltransferase